MAGQEKCAQPVPKAVNHRGFFYDKHTCPQRDSIPEPRALQPGMLPLDHCDLGVLYVCIEEGEKVAHFAFGLKRQWLTLKPAHPLVCLLKRMSRNCDYVEGSLLARVVPLPSNSGCSKPHKKISTHLICSP